VYGEGNILIFPAGKTSATRISLGGLPHNLPGQRGQDDLSKALVGLNKAELPSKISIYPFPPSFLTCQATETNRVFPDH
jgi:hypothetical protein